MGAEKGKKMKVEDPESVEEVQNLDEIDGEILITVEKLQELQDELEKVAEEQYEKVVEVEQKYNEIRKPVYTKRAEVIRAIPEFWSTAFMSHPYLNDLLRAEDQKVFNYLISLEVEDFKDVKSGYAITFKFKPNPYFEDTKLSKTFIFPENEMPKVTGTTIKWKEGMDISVRVNQEKKGKKRALVDDRDSFFCWFSKTKADDIVEVSDDDEDIMADVPFLHVAEVIKEELWPNPLKYYNIESDDEDVIEEIEEDDESGKDDNGDEDESNDEEEEA